MHFPGSSRARSEEMHLGMLSAVTCTSSHSSFFNSAEETIWPAFSSKRRSAANSFGAKCIRTLPRKSDPSVSKRKPAKENRRSAPFGGRGVDRSPVSGASGKADNLLFVRSNATPRSTDQQPTTRDTQEMRMAVDSGRRIRIWTIWKKYNSPEKCSASVKSTAFVVVLIMKQPGSRERDEHANKRR